MTKQRPQKRVEGLLFGEPFHAAGEHQFFVTESALQAGYELTAKDTAEYVHRQEESIAWVDPMLMTGGEAAGRDHAVGMRMNAPAPTIP